MFKIWENRKEIAVITLENEGDSDSAFLIDINKSLSLNYK